LKQKVLLLSLFVFLMSSIYLWAFILKI